MAVSTPGIQHLTADPSAGFYENLNSRWHKAALLGFTAIVLFHWSEHIVQAYQFFVLHWPRPMSMGLVVLQAGGVGASVPALIAHATPVSKLILLLLSRSRSKASGEDNQGEDRQ